MTATPIPSAASTSPPLRPCPTPRRSPARMIARKATRTHEVGALTASGLPVTAPATPTAKPSAPKPLGSPMTTIPTSPPLLLRGATPPPPTRARSRPPRINRTRVYFSANLSTPGSGAGASLRPPASGPSATADNGHNQSATSGRPLPPSPISRSIRKCTLTPNPERPQTARFFSGQLRNQTPALPASTLQRPAAPVPPHPPGASATMGVQ